jgi:hypothetical protein
MMNLASHSLMGALCRYQLIKWYMKTLRRLDPLLVEHIMGWENNLSNQNGFVEKSDGKITSAIKLSPDLKDSVIQLRFWIGTDLSGGDLGWKITSICVAVMLPKPAPTMP